MKKIKTRHLFFSCLYYLIGMTILNIFEKFMPEHSFLKLSVMLIINYILLLTLIKLWKSNIMDGEPSAFMWVATFIVLVSGFGLEILFA